MLLRGKRRDFQYLLRQLENSIWSFRFSMRAHLGENIPDETSFIEVPQAVLLKNCCNLKREDRSIYVEIKNNFYGHQ
jgi:hypothetical protein